MSWLTRVFARKRLETDLEKELRFHFETQVGEKMQSGVSESEARRLTRLEFGGIEQIKEDRRRLPPQFPQSPCLRLRVVVGLRAPLAQLLLTLPASISQQRAIP